MTEKTNNDLSVGDIGYYVSSRNDIISGKIEITLAGRLQTNPYLKYYHIGGHQLDAQAIYSTKEAAQCARIKKIKNILLGAAAELKKYSEAEYEQAVKELASWCEV